MSKSETKKLPSLVSPLGEARFPRLNEPETEVNGQTLETPRFTVTLRFNEEDEGVAQFKAELEELHAAAVAQAEARTQRCLLRPASDRCTRPSLPGRRV